MKNKTLRNVLICVGMIFMIAAGIYLGLAFYYKQVFVMNTWVNGVYCTGKSVEEVNRELLQYAEAPFLTLKDKEGNTFKLTSEDIELTLDYTKELDALLQSQESFSWPVYVSNIRQLNLVPEIAYDAEKLKSAVSQLRFVIGEAENLGELKMIMTEDGYTLLDTMKDRLDESAMYAYLNLQMTNAAFLTEGLENGEYFIDLTEGQCYKDITPDAVQVQTLKRWEILESYVNCGIVYDMGAEKIALAGAIASSFITVDETGEICFDENGKPVIDESRIEAFINKLAEEYNTYKKELTFTSTAGEEKTVPYVTYGTEIDTEKEIEYLKAAFAEKRKENHIPSYSRKGYARGRNDIGDTYIEVDMGNQKLYAYLDGALLVETDIVTGNVKRKMSTPEGVVYVYKKQRNRTLRGPGYASFVKYWMPVKGGIGLHDASWREEFGGEIYKTDGSHGCINIPRAVMSDIYDNFEVGTPVILFY